MKIDSWSNRNFTTIENDADEIIAYIDENFHGKIFMLLGLSLGGQILTDILKSMRIRESFFEDYYRESTAITRRVEDD